jgi:hypothetical protein
MLRFVSGFAIALLISMPSSSQVAGDLKSAVHLNEHDVPWPELVAMDEASIPEELKERAQELRRMQEIMRWKTLVGTGGRFGEALPDPDIPARSCIISSPAAPGGTSVEKNSSQPPVQRSI